MSHCPVESSINRYISDMDDLNEACEWVERGPVLCPICPGCGLIFATFERAPSSSCGRCLEKSKYPWVNGKRAKWTGGVIMDEDNIDYPEPDPDYGRDD